MTPRWWAAASAVGALVLTLLLAGLSLAVGGYDPIEAFGALLRGALGSPSAVLSITLVRTVPLLLTGLAVALAFRAGVWNIGAEGQLYAGAVAAVWVGLQVAALPAWAAGSAVLLGAAIAGAAWAAVPALMKLRLGVGEVITTLLLNFVAIELSAWMVHGPLQEPRGVFPQTEAIADVARLPIVVAGTRLHLGFVIAVGVALLLAAALRWTRVGFFVRAVGASNGAARVSGRVPVARVVLGVFLLSGALAGLAGGVEVSGVTFVLYEDLSPGHGYTAIAVALLAGLHPVGVVGTAVLFGVLEGGASAMQRDAGVPAAWVDAVQALVILSVLVMDRVARRGLERWREGRG
ncbi:ABC transporter permease [Gaopeijia maritima]|uniref:ABC transporter permease n=1 Tax=Gaopeijia maritima TaxID=3119007 RepID=A0ABU9E7S7_9BACT